MRYRFATVLERHFHSSDLGDSGAAPETSLITSTRHEHSSRLGRAGGTHRLVLFGAAWRQKRALYGPAGWAGGGAK